MKYRNIKLMLIFHFLITAIYVFSGCRQMPPEIYSSTETIIIDKTDVSSENNSSVEDTTSVEEKPVVSEPTEKPVTSKEETPSSPQVKPSEPSQTTKPETKPETKPTQNQGSSSSTSGKKVVQRADPETGISWDGVSPIVYTYADGTTGTEKREGATYEAYPGMITTVVTIEKGDGEYDHHCDYCGKPGGDGANGTCVRYWTGGDHTCERCGTVIPEDTCHTCAE